jgi:hypothetical protein
MISFYHFILFWGWFEAVAGAMNEGLSSRLMVQSGFSLSSGHKYLLEGHFVLGNFSALTLPITDHF